MTQDPDQVDPDLDQARMRFQGRFELEEKLGQGGMGAVFRARRGDAQYALKVLSPRTSAGTTLEARFQQEGRILSTLDHPNVIKVHEIGEVEGWHYLLCEYVEGESLEKLLLRQGRLPWDRALDVILQVLQGLEAAHGRDIIHRDIKPSNILAGEDGILKIADFGIAKSRQPGSIHTTTGVIVGTPAYIAPEVLKGTRPSPRSDLYSVGVVLFELLAGRLPWDPADGEALLSGRLRGDAPRLSSHLSGVPADLDDLIRTAMAPAPVDRYPSARTFRTALESTARGLAARGGIELLPRDSHRNRPMDASLPRPAPAVRQKSQPSTGRAPWPVIVMALAVVASSRIPVAPRPPDPGSGAPVAVSLEGPPPDPSERVLVENLRQAAPGSPAEQALANLRRCLDVERATQLLYRSWCLEPVSEITLRDALAARVHPLAIPALIRTMITPAASAEERTRAAGAFIGLLEALEVDGFDPLSCPRRDLVLSGLCGLLERAQSERAHEEPVVLRAAIRGLGWLADPGTPATCMLAIRGQSNGAYLEEGLVESSGPDLADRALSRIRSRGDSSGR